MQLMDCTLRDGANVVGKGFSAELTEMMIKGLIACGITIIEMGNALGVGAYDSGSVSPLTDEEYLEILRAYRDQAEIGMFMGVKNAVPRYIDRAVKGGAHFLRIGANAGDGADALEGIKYVKKSGIKAYYSLMKGYILSPKELAEEALRLEECGLDSITIMDSAGTMMPAAVADYVGEMSSRLRIPVGFHGHNNLGLSVANALAAQKAGAQLLDCGLLGMARSAGNLATELAVAAFQREGLCGEVDLYSLLDFLDSELIPAMQPYGYHTAVTPLDLIYGLAGCHSSFEQRFAEVAQQKGVPLYRLIVEVSAVDRKNPSAELMERVADRIKG